MDAFALTFNGSFKASNAVPSVIDYINENFVSNVLDFVTTNLTEIPSLVCFDRNLVGDL